MNGRQLIAVWLGVAAEVLAFLFPPFRSQGSRPDVLGGGSVNDSSGYHFVAASGHGHPDLPLLALEMLVVAAAFGAAALTLRGRPFDPMAHASPPAPRGHWLPALLLLLAPGAARAQTFASPLPLSFDAPDHGESAGWLVPAGGSVVWAFEVYGAGGLMAQDAWHPPLPGDPPAAFAPAALYESRGGALAPVSPLPGLATGFWDVTPGVYYVRQDSRAARPLTDGLTLYGLPHGGARGAWIGPLGRGAVPEPSALWLLCAGGVLLAARGANARPAPRPRR